MYNMVNEAEVIILYINTDTLNSKSIHITYYVIYELMT